jgi:hypothetical protein
MGLRRSGAEEAAKKAEFGMKLAEDIPGGLKPGDDLIGFMPGINPRPTARMSFSAGC